MTRSDIYNECQILSIMNHPSICNLREHFEINGGSEVVMVLELLSGRGLHSSTLQLNLSAFCVTGAALRGCFGDVKGVVGGIRVCFCVRNGSS